MEYQNKERCDKRFGLFKNFTVKCNKCEKELIVNEREKLFPQKEKYYCGRGCANSRVHNDISKEKIRKALTKNNVVKIICKQCSGEFEVPYKERKQLFCSRSCAAIFKGNVIRNTIKNKPIIKIRKEKDINKITFIYSLEYPLGNIRYIGKSDHPKARLKDHIKEAKQRNKSHKDKWLNSLSELPILNIIEETTYADWQAREMYWIKFYKGKGFNLVNGTDGGEGSNGFLGKTHTIENRKKLAECNKNRIISQETKDKLSGENSGRCKLKDDEVRDVFHMFCDEHKTRREIADKYNINPNYINQLISGRKRKNIFNEFNSL